MTRPVKIAPSLLSADFAHLADELAAIESAGADWIHLDVMDGHFVPNLSFGPPVIAALRPLTDKTFDAHLMVQNPTPLLPAYAKAGADIITIHPEATADLPAALKQIRDLGCKAGAALKPETPLDVLKDVMGHLDLILILTVNPGFSGQTFMPLHDKIRTARALIDDAHPHILLQVDGGLNAGTAPGVIAAGADILVAGAAVFTGNQNDYAANIQKLRGAV